MEEVRVGTTDVPPVPVEDSGDSEERCTAAPGCYLEVVSSGEDWRVCEYHARLLCVPESDIGCDELWHEMDHPHITQEQRESVTRFLLTGNPFS